MKGLYLTIVYTFTQLDEYDPYGEGEREIKQIKLRQSSQFHMKEVSFK